MLNLQNLIPTIVRKNGHSKYQMDRKVYNQFQRFLGLKNKPKIEIKDLTQKIGEGLSDAK